MSSEADQNISNRLLHTIANFCKFRKFLCPNSVNNMNNVSVWIPLMSRQGQTKEFFTDDEREECSNH